MTRVRVLVEVAKEIDAFFDSRNFFETDGSGVDFVAVAEFEAAAEGIGYPSGTLGAHAPKLSFEIEVSISRVSPAALKKGDFEVWAEPVYAIIAMARTAMQSREK